MFCITINAKNYDEVAKTINRLGYSKATSWLAYIDSDNQEISRFVAHLSNVDSRFKLVNKEKNIDLSGFDFVMPILEGDEVFDGLLLLKQEVIEKIDCFYTDSVVILNGIEEVQVKPAFSQELQFSSNYIQRLIYSTRLVVENKLPVFIDNGFDVYKNVLELCKKGVAIKHLDIKGNLYYSNALTEKSWDANLVTAREYAKVFGYNGNVKVKKCLNKKYQKNIFYYDVDYADSGPTVEILIPTKNNKKILERSIKSIVTLTSYKNFTVTIIDNDSTDPEVTDYYKKITDKRVRVVKVPNKSAKFSYSYVNNTVALASKADFLCFLNDDTEILSSEWLSQMVGWCKAPGVGSVGALLLYPNNVVQHTGICHKALSGLLPMTINRGLQDVDTSILASTYIPHSCSAVSAACMLTPRALFTELGGFDDVDFSVAYNDCDYGFKLQKSGRRSVFCPNARVTHYEGYTRGHGYGNDNPNEEAKFIAKYKDFEDPYWHPAYCITDTTGLVNRLWPKKVGEGRIVIGMFSHNLNFEGAPLVLAEIAIGIQARYSWDIIFFSPLDGPLRDVLEKNNIVVKIPENLGVFGNKNAFEYESQIAFIQSVIKSNKLDIVLCNTVLNIHTAIAAETSLVPAIVIIHESEQPFVHLAQHGGVHELYAKKLISKVSQVVFVCESTRQYYNYMLGLHQNTRVIYNGFDFEKYAVKKNKYEKDVVKSIFSIPDNTLIGLCLGTVCERKRQLDAIELIRKLDQNEAEKITLLIVGARDDAYGYELRRQVAELGSRAKCIKIVPIVDNPEVYLSMADFFISFSQMESYPKSIQEALFFNLPVIAAAVFGVKELVNHNYNGYFFDVGDIEVAAKYVRKLINEEGVLESLKANCDAGSRKFNTLSEMIDAYGQLCWSAVNQVRQLNNNYTIR